MHKLLLFPVLILLIFTGCGTGPSPTGTSDEDEFARLRAKMEAAQKQQFASTQAAISGRGEQYVADIDREKSKDDPSAYVYEDKVLTLEEEKLWINEGIDNDEYPLWAKLGMKADEVNAWKDLNISYAAIGVFYTQGYTPSKVQKHMEKKFFARPTFYAQYGTPVYEFDSICQAVSDEQKAPFAFLEEKCLPYMEASHKNEAIGHLLDETGVTKGPLVVEYLAELRRLTEKNSEIQSGMEVSIEEFVEDEDTQNFAFLFPLLKNEPTSDEMKFIDVKRIQLQKTERFLSYKNPKYWAKKAAQKKAAKAAAAREEARIRAKREKAQDEEDRAQALLKLKALKKEKARLKKIADAKAAIANKRAVKREALRQIKAQAVCGKYIFPDQFSNQEAFLEGKVVFAVGEHGDKMFGYGVKSRSDQKIYFVRDPKNAAKAKLRSNISWKLKTMGRTEALAKISDIEYAYDKKSKTKYPMALYVKECKQ